MPDRKPTPRADLRRFNLALGPVVVFGASNFPLAFSVAGNDTASALAAGCPVIVKGHPAHPGTGELAARAVIRAVASSGLPEGVFSYLPGPDHALGEALVGDRRIRAVGFTGSRSAGLALQAVAAARPQPIPVFAEMSSVNPVVILPGAMARDPEALATAYVQSLCLGAGQFCTNPGLVFAVGGSDLDRFVETAAASMSASPPAVMLTAPIKSAYQAAVDRLADTPKVRVVVSGVDPSMGAQARPSLFVVKGADFAANADLSAEIFGAAGVIVECADAPEIGRLVRDLEGQLTATLHFAPSDQTTAEALLPVLVDRAGRVLTNGWPTGVEVCEAMVHGGPYPATTDGGRSTSVGALAMQRFVRPVCYQDVPDALLPPPIRDDNPWRAPRRVDGQWAPGL
jgi:NADP-dependent aldehyde dehydrogenase